MALKNLAPIRRARCFPDALRARACKAHAVVAGAVTGAVLCSVVTSMRSSSWLILCRGRSDVRRVWLTFILVVALIAGDNLLWRVAQLGRQLDFVGVTGDVRRDLFRHLTGHAPSYFAASSPGRAYLASHSHGQCGCSLWRTCSCGMCCRPAWRRFARLSSLAR